MVPDHSNKYDMKVQLHSHPHFFGPTSRTDIDEVIYKRIRPVPTLASIVNFYISHGFRIGVISACHPNKHHVDSRFENYMSQLRQLEMIFDIDSHLDAGWISLKRKNPSGNLPDLIIPKSQEVRTDYGGEKLT